jgi:hypothetical protein
LQLLYRIISIALLLTISFQWVAKMAVVADWKINQEYITQTSCINRDKPQLECDGKCQLQKRLDAIDSEQSSQESVPVQKIKFAEFEKFVSNSNFQLNAVRLSNDLEYNIAFSSLYSFNFIGFCFHPPAVLV